ncbi:hypothetical protein N7449_006447 [Penicillium cf. viridicatum]|uniref:Uncharacterized protein n=1 Tax=Penicillium cf. viridicatum TaxID=2972119 RepID=A0A9W9MBM2_9EURO|nr:hypothetical protein N7449_006447 [Penicillium cf. viridicatum]
MRTFIALLFSGVFASVSFLNFARQLFGQREPEPTDPSLTQGVESMEPSMMSRSRYEPDYEDIIYWMECEDKTYWVRHNLGSGVTVLGFPSKGGIYVLRNCFG